MLSIIIPAFNQHQLTQECALRVAEMTADCEIIIIDNGSTPPIAKPYVGFTEVTVIRNEENTGFPAAVNQGIKAATGDYICLLNNDCTVTEGWALGLMEGLERFDIVGPMTNFCAGMQQITIPCYNTLEELDNEAEHFTGIYAGSVTPVRWVIGFCMAFRKSVFDDVGEFDESLWPCSGEEINFCLCAGENGYTVGIVGDVYVHHDGSTTFRDMDSEHPYIEIIEKTDAHLIKRWGKDVYHQMPKDDKPEDGSVRLNLGCGPKDRHLKGYVNIDVRQSAEPDVCFDISEGLPYADASVDEVRAWEILEHVHVDKTQFVVHEIWRVLKPGGLFESYTPSTDGRGAFQDPTHRSFWNRNSWLYYSHDAYRALYSTEACFDIEELEEDINEDQVHTRVMGRAVK